MTEHSTDISHPAPASGVSRDIRPRIISGLVFGLVALALNYAGPKPFALLVLAVAVLVSWEWGRVVRGRDADPAFFIHAIAVSAACVAAALDLAAIGVLLLAIGAIIVLLVQVGDHGRLSGLGVIYAGLPAVSLLWIRSDEPYGFVAVLFVLLVVVVTDTCAYFGGRLIGGPRLWPRVSPNKTWAGLISGVVCASIVAGLFSLLLPDPVPLRLAMGGFILALVSQAGDLTESALKRGFGVKDASTLIPGHGGFLDRVDGVVFAAAAAALLALAVDMQAPAHAILFWS
jgi:phosphatidate cytidylyltransferase